VPNPGLIDDDAPETTDEQLAGMRPAREVLPPDFYAMVTKRKLGPSDPANRENVADFLASRARRAAEEIPRDDLSPRLTHA
jgi:uncharacterized protein (DUF4415 family)